MSEDDKREKRKKKEQKRIVKQTDESSEVSEDESTMKRSKISDNPLSLASSSSNTYQKRSVNNADTPPRVSQPASPVGTSLAHTRSSLFDSNRSRSAEIYQMSKATDGKFTARPHSPKSCDSTIIKNILCTDSIKPEVCLK